MITLYLIRSTDEISQDETLFWNGDMWVYPPGMAKFYEDVQEADGDMPPGGEVVTLKEV